MQLIFIYFEVRAAPLDGGPILKHRHRACSVPVSLIENLFERSGDRQASKIGDGDMFGRKPVVLGETHFYCRQRHPPERLILALVCCRANDPAIAHHDRAGNIAIRIGFCLCHEDPLQRYPAMAAAPRSGASQCAEIYARDNRGMAER